MANERQLGSRKRRQVLAWALGLVAAAGIAAYMLLAGGNELPSPQALNLAPQQRDARPVYGGEPWVPGPLDGEGFAVALEAGSYELRIHPQTTQIIVTDKRSDYSWRSNPSEGQAAVETVKGLLLSNLKSPIGMAFFHRDDRGRREIANVSSKGVEVSFQRYADGLQISYQFTGQAIGLVVQYELSEHGLSVYIPDAGIQEQGEYALFSLDVLPYFGAAQAGEDGYILVPDGPGGLIDFAAERSSVSQGYTNQIYGAEVSNVRPDLRSSKRRPREENIPYPVFGMKRGEQGYVAIVQAGKEEAEIKAMPPGLKSSYYNVHASFQYREEYLRRNGVLSAPVKMIETARMKLDRSVAYLFLSGEQANYAGMARAYREQLIAGGQLGGRLEPREHLPLILNIVGGNSREAFQQAQYMPATTFSQAEQMVASLEESGVADMHIMFYGWQDGGDFNAAKRLPIERALGGEQAARRFLARMHEQGYPVWFEDNLVYVDAGRSAINAKADGARGIDGTVFFNADNEFLLKPALSLGMAAQTIAKLKEMGVDGMLYNWFGELVFRDYEAVPTERWETGELYRNLLLYTAGELGGAGVYRGNDYSLGAASHISEFPLDGSYDLMVDETVPFYPIALHGYVTYSGRPGNLRDDAQGEFLRAIEYGALPAFTVTWESSRLLKNTGSAGLFSSEFRLWKERIVAEYEAFDKLAGLHAMAIIAHERRADGVYATTYEDGTTVIVDYGRHTFEIEEGGGL